MPSNVELSAQAIAEALAPSPSVPAARWRWGTVVSVGNDGTMNVSIGGATVPGIRCAQHVMGAQVGDRVRVLYCGTECMVDAVRATSGLQTLPSIEAAAITVLGNPVNTTAAGIDSQGHDSDWYWVKFSDGMAVCEYEGPSASFPATSQAGGIYYGSKSGLPDFPITFVYVPTMAVSLGTSGNAWTWVGNTSATNPGTVYIGRGASATLTAAIKLVAVGRWK